MLKEEWREIARSIQRGDHAGALVAMERFAELLDLALYDADPENDVTSVTLIELIAREKAAFEVEQWRETYAEARS